MSTKRATVLTQVERLCRISNISISSNYNTESPILVFLQITTLNRFQNILGKQPEWHIQNKNNVSEDECVATVLY